MKAFFHWVDRMNLVVWSLAIFAAHLLLYFMLGTEHWVMVALEAGVVWAIGLLVLKATVKAVNKGNREEAR